MVGRQLPFFSLIVPFWLIWAFAGWRGMIEVWPAMLVAGAALPSRNILISNYHGPWLVDVLCQWCRWAASIAFLNYGVRKRSGRRRLRAASRPDAGNEGSRIPRPPPRPVAPARAQVVKRGSLADPQRGRDFSGACRSSRLCSTASRYCRFQSTGVHNLIERMPPVVVKPTVEAAVYVFNWLSCHRPGHPGGSPLLPDWSSGFSPLGLVRTYWEHDQDRCATRC